MKPTKFMILAAVTAIFVFAAVVAVLGQREPAGVAADRERAFPALAERINDVTRISIKSGKASFTVERGDAGWGLTERSGYPVHFDKVKAAIVGLAELKLLESKTSDPARHARLHVENPDSLEARSVAIELRDAGGETLAAAIVGKLNANLFGSGGGGTYLRKGGEDLSWLAEGEVSLGAERNDWLVRDVVDIDADDVTRAVIRQPDGAEIVVDKPKPDDKEWSVSGVPEGRTLKKDEGKNLAGGLWRLTFEDVKPAAELAFPERFHVAEYRTFDGLAVRVEITFVDDVAWGRFSALADDARGDEETRQAVAEKAGEINARTKGWVYELSAGEGERLTTKIDDVLEKPKES